MTIQAIETRYAGCRFRSRLEARWAVFFDHFDITWEYEPQGYLIDDLAGTVWTGSYLPDFYLATRWTGWAEVKGNPGIEDVRKVAAAAIPHGGLPGPNNRIWLLGPFGRPDEYPAIVILHFYKGEVFYARPWEPSETGRYLAADSGDFDTKAAEFVANWWSQPSGHLPAADPPTTKWRSAITAARSARFEHGEAG